MFSSRLFYSIQVIDYRFYSNRESDSGNETVAPRCPGVRLGHLFSRCQPLHLLSARCPWLVRGDRWLRMTPSATIEDECLERCLTSIHLPQKTNT